MARTETAGARFKYGNDDFPILFDDGRVRVFKNPTNDIFVEDIRSGATMRISSDPRGRGGLPFVSYERGEPIQVNGTIGWRVSPY